MAARRRPHPPWGGRGPRRIVRVIQHDRTGRGFVQIGGRKWTPEVHLPDRFFGLRCIFSIQWGDQGWAGYDPETGLLLNAVLIREATDDPNDSEYPGVFYEEWKSWRPIEEWQRIYAHRRGVTSIAYTTTSSNEVVWTTTNFSTA